MSKQPKEMYFLSFIEMCQRFAFWGIGNLLVLFLVQEHRFSDASATHLYGLFTGAAFALPMLGGYIADRTSYRAGVICGCLSTALGCFLIATGSIMLLYVALLFAALGASIFTPSVYSILGNVYHGNPSLREGGFTIYYAAVNIGVFLATFTLGALGHANLWLWAFVLAGTVQIIGLLIFLKIMKRPAFAAMHIKQQKTGTDIKKTALTKNEKQRIVVICILSVVSILFWMSYNQGWSSMSIFALRYTAPKIGSITILPSWLLSLESLYLVILAFPLAWIYKCLAKRRLDPSPALKTVFSLVAMGLCFFLMKLGSRSIPVGAEAMVSPFYLIGAYAFMAIGEMLLAPIGLSMVTHLSPRRLTAFFVGAWYMCIGIAFYAGGLIAGLIGSMELADFFNIFVLVSWIPAVLLLFGVKKLKEMSHTNTL